MARISHEWYFHRIKYSRDDEYVEGIDLLMRDLKNMDILMEMKRNMLDKKNKDQEMGISR